MIAVVLFFCHTRNYHINSVIYIFLFNIFSEKFDLLFRIFSGKYGGYFHIFSEVLKEANVRQFR